MEIREGAIFVADVHYLKGVREEFIEFLNSVEQKKPPQLFLLGDIFELLFSPIEESIQHNLEAINLLNRVSESIEVIYLEGNHDFQLQKVFPKIGVVRHSKQPKLFNKDGLKIYIQHGDQRVGFSYKLYRTLVDSKPILTFLNLVNSAFNGSIYGRLLKNSRKEKCGGEWKEFKKFVERRVAYFPKDSTVIEGHFHQNRAYKFGDITYFNLPSFACNQSFFIVESKKDSIVFSNINLKDF
jgi:UDP-2,3-diacylglucosamine hydrolase